MEKKVKQIIGYKIQEGQEVEFLKIKDQMIKESKSLEGLYSSTTSKSLDENNVYIDTMVWQSKQNALDACENFRELPTANKFMELMTGPPLFQYMMEFEKDTI